MTTDIEKLAQQMREAEDAPALAYSGVRTTYYCAICGRRRMAAPRSRCLREMPDGDAHHAWNEGG